MIWIFLLPARKIDKFAKDGVASVAERTFNNHKW